MAAQKPVKGAKTASKGSSSKEAISEKTIGAKKTGSLKGLPKVEAIAKVKKAATKIATVKSKATKNTKPTIVPAVVKKAVKAVGNKLQEKVKKTQEADKKEAKEVAVKNVAPSEKKAKSEVAVEKEPKPAKTATTKVKAESSKPVVIPKTSTDKKVDYEPDFLKSVLDVPATVPQGPTMRYSDAELQEFRDLIGKKLDAAKKELAYLQGLITRRDEMGGDETDNRYMTMEDGGMSMEREQLSQMASRQITFIDHLEKAIMRIENKTYGICRVTGKLIDKARLRAVPHATLSMEAKLGITK